jgi:hypothetical protein
VAALLAAEKAFLFSQAERETIVRLTSPGTVYRAMTEAIETLRETRFRFELAGSGKSV